MDEQKFIPVIVGADIGAYSLARSFYEMYNIKSKVMCSYKLWQTDYSKIVDVDVIPNLTSEKLVEELIKFANENKDIKKLLFGCSEWYVDIIIENKEELEKYYIMPCVNKATLDNIVQKENFYKICEEIGIDYPKTIIVGKENYKKIEIPWKYPIVAKASNKNDYHYAEFEGKKKVFIIKDKQELDTILNNAYNSSYSDTFILQEFVDGDDSNMRVLTCYCNKDSDVVFSCLGQPLLEENTPGSIGNYATIINRKMEPQILEQAKKFLKYVKYVGYANFDIKYDPKDNKYKYFEINVRLGRSNFYMTGSGANYTPFVVDEYIMGKKLQEEVIAETTGLYTIVPNIVIKKYVRNKELVKEALNLKKQGKYTYPLYYKKDKNIKRWIYAKLSIIHQIFKFKKYYDKIKNISD